MGIISKVAMAGDFILAVASMMIARLRDNDVTLTLSQGVKEYCKLWWGKQALGAYVVSTISMCGTVAAIRYHTATILLPYWHRTATVLAPYVYDTMPVCEDLKVVTDLVQGEFMQLGSKETENERFAHYLTKTYRKTASLLANSVKATAMLAGADDALSEVVFQYGRNVGLAFQLVDDLLDFVSSSAAMGKPTAADLKLGLATAPVLFACEKYPELNPMIMRRFQEPGDVERAFELVHKSQGLEQTRFLARKHCIEAARHASSIAESPYQKGLQVITDLVINRLK
uniref:Uncharacterized protein n=1 Tax=Timema tahoe TaxID=61484 RepID=A0A7R9NZW7_9NEOP|nr:unnamed protein product [Timema tahoe]